MKAQLFTKIAKAAIGELGENIRAPKGAKTYNFVSGTGQKGKFEIYTFFDEAGKIIKRNSSYINGEDTTQIVTQYSDVATRTAKIFNGRAESITKKCYRYGDKNRCLFSEATTKRGCAEDVQKLTYLERGKAPQTMEVRTSWDGNTPQITYTNTNPIFDSEDKIVYLPAILDGTSLKRYEHIYKSQIKEQDLEDVFDTFKLIRNIDLPNHFDIKELDDQLGVAGVFDDIKGNVYYVVGDKTSIADEVEVIAHEVQHAKDFSDIARLKDTMRYDCNKAYYDKSRAKGIIMKSKQKKDYKRLSELRASLTNDEIYKKECLKGRHDDLPIEISANWKGVEESEACSNVWRKIMVHFGFWGG